MLAKLECPNLEVRPVRIALRSPEEAPSLARDLADGPRWLLLESTQDTGLAAPITELFGSREHGRIVFAGSIEGLLVEPFTLALRTLATGEIEWATEDSADLLQELERAVDLEVLVSPWCPFCATAAEAAVRFAAASPKVSVIIRRADIAGLPEGAHALPTVLADSIIVAEGAFDEHHLLRQVAVYQRSQPAQSGVTCVSPSERGQPVPGAAPRSTPPGPRATRRPQRSTAA